MIDRVFCSVPGCRRFSFNETCVKRWGTTDVSFICQQHWRRLTKAERQVWARLKRISRRIGWNAIGSRTDRIWDALRRRSSGVAQ